MNHYPMRSSLARLPNSEERDVKFDTYKRHLWHDKGVAVLSVEDGSLHWTEQQQVNQIATRIYGRRWKK